MKGTFITYHQYSMTVWPSFGGLRGILNLLIQKVVFWNPVSQTGILSKEGPLYCLHTLHASYQHFMVCIPLVQIQLALNTTKPAL